MMTPDDIRNIQKVLKDQGYFPFHIDGVWTPETAAAYSKYWEDRHVEISVPIQAPEAAKPWWTSRGIWGPLLILAAVPVQLTLGITYDPEATTELLIPLIEAIPQFMVGVGGALAWFGRTKAQSPIDINQVLPHVRLPVTDWISQPEPESEGYWKRKRGGLDEH